MLPNSQLVTVQELRIDAPDEIAGTAHTGQHRQPFAWLPSNDLVLWWEDFCEELSRTLRSRFQICCMVGSSRIPSAHSLWPHSSERDACCIEWLPRWVIICPFHLIMCLCETSWSFPFPCLSSCCLSCVVSPLPAPILRSLRLLFQTFLWFLSTTKRICLDILRLSAKL